MLRVTTRTAPLYPRKSSVKGQRKAGVTIERKIDGMIPMRPATVNLTPPRAFVMIASRAAWRQDTSSPPCAPDVVGQKEMSHAFPTRG
jgi:hypothetical protein